MDANNSQVEYIAENANREMARRIQILQKINIMVIGKSGVGKTYMIKKIFGEVPDENEEETSDIEFHIGRTRNLNAYDFPGFEPDEQKMKIIKGKIFKIIKDGIKTRDINNYIHCILYCIGPEIQRFNDGEVNFIKKITDQTTIYNIPVIVVLTQSFDDHYKVKMIRKIKSKNLPIIKIVPILAGDRIISFNNQQITIPAYGIDTLLSTMRNVLPRHLRETLIAIQKASLKSKRRWAIGIVATSILLSAGIEAFNFNSITSWISLGATITGMFAGIMIDYGIMLPTQIIVSFIGFVYTNRDYLLTVFNEDNLKWIPRAGKIIGAGLITAIIGALFAYFIDCNYVERVDLSDMTASDIQTHISSILFNVNSQTIVGRFNY